MSATAPWRLRPDGTCRSPRGRRENRRRLLSTLVLAVSTFVLVSEPAHDLPVSSPAVEKAVKLASRGVITYLTIHGKRVAAIVPESVIEALRAAEDAEDAAEADAAMEEPGESIPWEQVKAELGL